MRYLARAVRFVGRQIIYLGFTLEGRVVEHSQFLTRPADGFLDHFGRNAVTEITEISLDHPARGR